MKHALAALSGAFSSFPAPPRPASRAWSTGRSNAMGGAERIAAIKTIAVKANVKQWEPEQSDVPGGETRFANEATRRSGRRTAAARASRTDWVKNFAYPAPRTFTYSEIVTPAGRLRARRRQQRPQRAEHEDEPAGAFDVGLPPGDDAARVAPRLADRCSSRRCRRARTRCSRAADVTVGTQSRRSAFDGFIVAFDPATGLPSRVRTLDYDNIWGDVTYDMRAVGLARVRRREDRR